MQAPRDARCLHGSIRRSNPAYRSNALNIGDAAQMGTGTRETYDSWRRWPYVMSARHLWLFFRYSRWLLWLAWLGYCIEFVIHREQHIGAFNELSLTTEVWMFGIPLVAILFGLLELMMRDRGSPKIQSVWTAPRPQVRRDNPRPCNLRLMAPRKPRLLLTSREVARCERRGLMHENLVQH